MTSPLIEAIDRMIVNFVKKNTPSPLLKRKKIGTWCGLDVFVDPDLPLGVIAELVDTDTGKSVMDIFGDSNTTLAAGACESQAD